MKIQFKRAVSFLMSAEKMMSVRKAFASSAEMGYETDERETINRLRLWHEIVYLYDLHNNRMLCKCTILKTNHMIYHL